MELAKGFIPLCDAMAKAQRRGRHVKAVGHFEPACYRQGAFSRLHGWDPFWHTLCDPATSQFPTWGGGHTHGRKERAKGLGAKERREDVRGTYISSKKNAKDQSSK